MVANVTGGTRHSANEYSTPVKQDASEYVTAVDSDLWNDTDHYETVIDGRSANSTEKFNDSLELEKGRHFTDMPQRARYADSNESHSRLADGVNLVGSGRLSSAMKLKCNIEPQSQPQEKTVSANHNPISPSSHPQSPLTSSVDISTQEHKSSIASKPSLLTSHPAPSRPSAQSRRTLSNEPLGAEFDVKQIKVRRASSSTSANDELDFFAGMAPVIAASSPEKSLLGLLSAAAAEASSTEATSLLNFTDQNHLDSSVSSFVICVRLYMINVISTLFIYFLYLQEVKITGVKS